MVDAEGICLEEGRVRFLSHRINHKSIRIYENWKSRLEVVIDECECVVIIKEKSDTNL